MSATFDPDSEGAAVERAELADFVREAAGGLGERDQLLLELSARQGLTGADLADAMGVTQQQCHVLLHRMRERVQRCDRRADRGALRAQGLPRPAGVARRLER